MGGHGTALYRPRSDPQRWQVDPSSGPEHGRSCRLGRYKAVPCPPIPRSHQRAGRRPSAASAARGWWPAVRACASSRVVGPRLLVEPAGAPDLTLQREGLLKLDLDLRPRLRAPALVQHRAQDAVDAEPGMPEAAVGVVHFPFGPRGPSKGTSMLQ